MILFANELSIRGQYPCIKAFLSDVEKVVNAWHCSKGRVDFAVSWNLRGMMATSRASVQHAVDAWDNKEKKRMFFIWATKSGPFIEEIEDKGDGPVPVFLLGDVALCDGGIRSAASRKKDGVDARTFSFCGDCAEFKVDPLEVYMRLRDRNDRIIEVPNIFELDKLLGYVKPASTPPTSWRSAVTTAKNQFPLLDFSPSILKGNDLTGQPFDKGACEKLFLRLGVLSRYMESRDKHGKQTSLSRKIIREEMPRNYFSDESPQNKETYRDDLTFSDAANNTKVFAPWHAKISTNLFRVHYDWPVAENQEKLRVFYIGRKITLE